MRIERRNKLRLLEDLKFELTKLNAQLKLVTEQESNFQVLQLLMLKSTIKDSIIKIQGELLENSAA